MRGTLYERTEEMLKILETQRLIIRQYTMDDLASLNIILSDPVTMSFWPNPYTLGQVEQWIRRNIESYHKNGFGRWGLILKEDCKLIGDVGIVQSQIDNQFEYDLGYIIHSNFWNQGFAFEAAHACLNYGLTNLGIGRICANMPYHHDTSRRVAEKIGMVFEKQFYNAKNRDILTNLYYKNKA